LERLQEETGVKTEILGIQFDNLTVEQAVDAGAALLQEEGFHYAVTPNPEFLLAAEQDMKFRAILNRADLTLADGIGVVYAAKILGTPLAARVPGIDFATGLLQKLSEENRGIRLFLLGAKPGIAQEAADCLGRQYPGITLCGTMDGYFQDEELAARAVAQANAQLLFICLGAPKQENWMARWGVYTGCRLAVGLGGALDVFAGKVERAPETWQKLGLEWAYRLKKEPQRISRMAKLPLVLVKAGKTRITGKGNS